MKFYPIPIFVILSLELVVSHAVPSEIYWQSVLPNTPMPKAVRNRLQPDWTVEKSTSVGAGKGGVDFNTGKAGGGTSVNRGFIYYFAASVDHLPDDPSAAFFFLEKDLHPGTKKTLNFTKTTTGAAFLPRQVAETIPFSSKKLPDILHRFSIEPKSAEAEVMKNTIKQCEQPAEKGEEKYCATSLESMVDFSISKLGTNIQAISTEVGKEETQKQGYSIAPGIKKMVSDETVVCHGQNYAYAVFYCHKTHTTRAYVVPLIGADGTKAKAVAVCHTDTSKWNPKHWTFQVLKVKPGVPICHFLPEDHIVYVPN